MADFYQTGGIATLHRLKEFDQLKMERELIDFTEKNKIALVLPALYTELEGPALSRIVDILLDVPYIDEIVIALDRATPEQFEHAKKFFSKFPHRHRVLWINGPRFQELKKMIEENGLTLGPSGKGLSCWFAYGYVLARGRAQIVALHDCDILTYSRELLARLCYPTANQNLNFRFCKGYYSRTTDKMNGRATRLFVTPMVRALKEIIGGHPLLDYLDSFRYALSGEFSMRTDLALINRVPCDWGLEIGVLAEVYRNCPLRGIAQSELCENYDHKHQDLSPGDPTKGLVKMSVDISTSLFRTLAAEGIEMSMGLLKTLLVKYVRTAEDTVIKYYADAKINGLRFDRHEEESAVDAFSQAIKIAADQFAADPLGAPLIPNWARVTSAYPDFFDKMLERVEEDNKKSMVAR